MKMRVILIFILTTYLIAPCVAMSTGVVRVFYNWTNSDQVSVTCNNSKIVQFCDPVRSQSCRNMNVSGVLLKKHGQEFHLIITDYKYNLCSCVATAYIDDIQRWDNFTVNLSNQKNFSQGYNDSRSGTTAVGVSVPIVVLVLLVLVLLILYCRVRRFRQAIRNRFSHLRAICDRFCHQQHNNRNPNEVENIEEINRPRGIQHEDQRFDFRHLNPTIMCNVPSFTSAFPGVQESPDKHPIHTDTWDHNPSPLTTIALL